MGDTRKKPKKTEQTMTDKEQGTSAPETPSATTAVAGAQASNQSETYVTVNVSLEEIGRTLSPRGSAPRSERKPPSSKPSRGASGPTAVQTPKGPTVMSAAVGRAPISSEGILEASGGHHYIDHINGDERHTLIDKDGSKIVVVRDSDTGHTKLTFDDTKVRFTTESDEPGFIGQRRLPKGYGGIRNVQMEVSASDTFSSAKIYCSDNVPALSWGGIDFDSTTTSNNDVGKLTVREIKEFTNRNPELGAELRSMRFTTGAPVIVTEADGRSISAAALNQLSPPAVQACPTGRDDDYKGIVAKR